MCSLYLGENTDDHVWHEYEKLHFCPFWCYFTGISICMYISYIIHKQCTRETSLKWSDVYVNVFCILRSTPSGTIEINLRSCVLNRHKLRQSQIAKDKEFLPSQYVICRNLWSRPWRGKLSPITLKTFSVYLGEYRGSLLTRIRKVEFLPILVLFHWYICVCVISVIMPINDIPKKPSWKGLMSMWTCFLY